MLVPEINLTPQLDALVRARFPCATVVTLHSGLNESERLHSWLAAQSGDAGIVLGTRLAIFTPLPKLGFDRRRRGARCLVQANGRAALFGA